MHLKDKTTFILFRDTAFFFLSKGQINAQSNRNGKQNERSLRFLTVQAEPKVNSLAISMIFSHIISLFTMGLYVH